MSSIPTVDKFIDTVPEKWLRDVKPVILKAHEFEKAKQPLVSYYLQTYAISKCMALHKDAANKAEKASTTPFLMSFLDHLEAVKSSPAMAKLIDENDGRTVLTKTALQLFAKADDAERTGQVSEGVVKLFFTSTILFEATKQYIDDATMDPICSEKHKYATIIALRMKKAISTKQQYVSPNGAKEVPMDMTPKFEDDVEAPPTQGGGGDQPPGYGGYTYNPPATTTTTPSLPPPPPPPPQAVPKPAPAQQHYVPAAPVVVAANCQKQYANALPSNGHAAPGHAQVFEAQKLSRQAVSALQFHDHITARKHLLSALACLDGGAQL